MPRVSREKAAVHREAIVDASAALFRAQGLNGVSVADLMGAAGLTHGGFYGHFESKDALAALACQRAFEQTAERWGARIAAQPDAPRALESIVENYVSASHRDGAGDGCAAIALAGDVAREDAGKPVRQPYLDGLEMMVAALASLQQPSATAKKKRAAAMVQLATMIGAVAIARATAQDGFSDEMLAAARAALLGQDAG